jgi:hypothetical protein
VMKRLQDAAVYPLRPSQVIRIDDQILHSLSAPAGSPVLLDSYSFVLLPVFVPLTLLTLNSSMA